MRRFVQTTRRLAVGLALVGATHQAAGQFVAINGYPAPAATPQTAYAPPQPAYAASQPNYTNQPGYAAPPNYAAATYPQVAYPPAASAPAAAAYPRVAQAAELPAPTEAIGNAAAAVTPEVAPTPAPATRSYGAPTMTYASPTSSYVSPAPAMSYTQPTAHAAYPTGSEGCATGDCGTTYATPAASYSTGYDSCYAPACDTAPACDVAAPARPRRQWFAGLYGLYLDRAGDRGKALVSYMTDTVGFAPGTPYYYQPTDTALFTTGAEQDATAGAEVRFGSTFGFDPCTCTPLCAWEVGYWAIDDDASSATFVLPGSVGVGNTQRVYTMPNYFGVNTDLDGTGGFVERPIYMDPGDPADGDIYASDVRIIAARVRQRFQAQNLELNFWRFGAQNIAPTFGAGYGQLAGAGGIGSCGAGSCGVDACGGCAPAACAPCRPPRRFFINGLAGVRYLRVDDDFGFDTYFAEVDTTGANQGNVPTGGAIAWNATYPGGFPIDDPQTMYSDFEADNELVGFQLGCSMNWLIGCRWSVFADSNFGIYGNNAQVNKRIYGGGGAIYTFANDGSAAEVQGSETNVAYVGELRAGIGYQISCRCRLTAAYRFIGIGGVALGVEEFQNTNWANRTVASHIDTNNSIILHGLQAGVETTF